MSNLINFIAGQIFQWRSAGKKDFRTIDLIAAINGFYRRDKLTPVGLSFNAKIGKILSGHCYDKDPGTYKNGSGKWLFGRLTPTLPIILRKKRCRVKDIEGQPSESALWRII